MEEKVEILEPENNEKPKKKNFPWKYILNICLVLIVTAVAVLVTVASSFDATVKAFSNVDWKYILVCLGMELASILCYSFIIFCFARLYTRKYRFHQALACDSIGRFWSGVTPGATGGQFMQAYTYKKQGVPISSAASIMIMYSMCYQFVLIIYGIVALIFKGKTLQTINALQINQISIPIIPLVIVGFILNLAFVSLLFFMSYSKKLHNFILGPCISFFAKIRILKNPDKNREDLRIQVENFKIELKRLLSNIPFLILIMILFFVAMTGMFGVPYFAAKALGSSMSDLNNFDGFVTSIFYSNFHQMVTGLIPVPGSAGVSEYFFFALFKDYFAVPGHPEQTYAAAGQLIWRTITFTLPLLIGGLVSAFYKCSPKEEASGKIGRETFVDIQHATYAERAASAKEQFNTSPLSKSAIMAKLLFEEQQEKPKKLNKKKKEKKPTNIVSPTNVINPEWEEINIKSDDKEDE